jgi:hypothetical protein
MSCNPAGACCDSCSQVSKVMPLFIIGAQEAVGKSGHGPLCFYASCSHALDKVCLQM